MKDKILSELRTAALVMEYLPEYAGYNGSMFNIDDTEKDRIIEAINSAVDFISNQKGESMRCSEADCDGDTPRGCQRYKRVEEIGDHMALACSCGSVKFNLLRTEKIECAGCGIVLGDTFWSCKNSKPHNDAGQG